MKKWKKWKIKFKIYSNLSLSNFTKFKMKEETKYRFCIYFIFYNLYKNYIMNILFYNFYKFYMKNIYFYKWKNMIMLINKLNNYLINMINPIKSFDKMYNKNKKQMMLEEFMPEMFNLIFLKKWQLMNLNCHFFKINFIYSMDNFFKLMLWIHLVKMDMFLLNKNDNYFYVWKMIYMHQQNCLNMNYFYNIYIFKKSLESMFYYLKMYLTNYMF